MTRCAVCGRATLASEADQPGWLLGEDCVDSHHICQRTPCQEARQHAADLADAIEFEDYLRKNFEMYTGWPGDTR